MWQRVKRPVYPFRISEFNQSYFLPEFQTLGSKRLEAMSEIEAKLFLDHRNARNWSKVGFLKGEKT